MADDVIEKLLLKKATLAGSLMESPLFQNCHEEAVLEHVFLWAPKSSSLKALAVLLHRKKKIVSSAKTVG
ncbi:MULTISPECIES: hypothetical protein [Bacillaceae]|uniref:hypothetical protein n=1 Tax=Bacillaceae TaxID=186817 RepID=UPI00296571C4|nr:hypothetical protein [Bacillus infantis]MDW2879691.1 hypothetical protein [Bacillus infantis]